MYVKLAVESVVWLHRVGETCDDTLQENLQNGAVQPHNADASETNHTEVANAQSTRSLASNGTSTTTANERTNRTVFFAFVYHWYHEVSFPFVDMANYKKN